MLPRATGERMRREAAQGKQSGRTQEIQRLIGRSLRAVVDLVALGERQITLDCDVIQADGGTRTAAITGSWIALHDASKWMDARAMFKTNPLRDHVAAISCGIHGGAVVLDLDYAEDSTAGTDANFVMTGKGGIVEIQGTAEGEPFSQERFLELLALARAGIGELVAHAEAGGRMKARAILETILYAEDIAAARRFYEGVLGLEVRRELEDRFVFFHCGDGMLLIFNPAVTEQQKPASATMPPPHGAHGPGHVCFRRQRRTSSMPGARISKASASPSRPISNGRAAAARSISAIPPAIRVEFAEPRIWGLPRRTLRGAEARRRLAQSGQGARDQRTAGSLWRRGRLGGNAGPARAGRDRDDFRGQCRAQGASGRASAPASWRLPMIPASASMRWTAIPASIRRAGPGPSKDFALAMRNVEEKLAGQGRDDAGAAPRAFRQRAVGRLARRPCREFRGPGRWHAGLAAARRHAASATIRCSCPTGTTQTFGEMDPDAKHAISHRARAFRKLVDALF